MRSLQNDPYSPATQPYNQGAKAFIGVSPGVGQNRMPVQQYQQPQQPNSINTMSTNPFDSSQPQPQQPWPTGELHSPVPGYAPFQASNTAAGSNSGAFTLENVQGIGTASPMKQPIMNHANPVTPIPQYDPSVSGIQTQQPQKATNSPTKPFEASAMIQPQLQTLTQQYGNPFGSNYSGSSAAGAQPQAPTTPPSIYNENKLIMGNYLQAPNNSGLVTPPSKISGNNPFEENNGADDLDFGPPMGTPVPGQGLSDASSAMVPYNKTDGPYHGLVNGMGALSVHLGVSPGQQQTYQNYSPSTFPAQPSLPQPEVQQPSAGNFWAGVEMQQQVQHQQNAYPNPTVWDYEAQSQQQTAYASHSSPWDLPHSEQKQQRAPNQGQGQGRIDPLPRLNHSPQAPYEGRAAGQGNGCEDVPYGPHSRRYDPMDMKPFNPIDEHKNTTDVIRERGAGIRALRLLEETTTHDYDYESCSRPKIKSLSEAAKLERAKLQQAKEIRKMKRLEYKNRRPEMLAESSREVKNVRRGYDPELVADKCQLDFDRQRDAQRKALKLMGIF